MIQIDLLWVLLGVLGMNEIIVILIVVLLLFGGKKIPELMRGLGRGMREFSDAKNNVKREIEDGLSDNDHQAKTTSSSNTTPQP
ncbi:MAG: twin-arginine translocase TatA/TatE family subunit [Bacteroidota bacterium]|nr:twin-arginine translocase TatA/TatE family subunit [Bacteroidota bacterium]